MDGPDSEIIETTPGARRAELDLDTQPVAPEALRAWVLERLPEEWRWDARVVLAPGGFAVGFHDPAGTTHILWARELEEGFRGLAEGRRLGIAYLEDVYAPPDADAVARYRVVAEALLQREVRLAEDLRRRGAGAPIEAVARVRPGFELMDQPAVDEGLGAWVRARLPEDGRADAKVVLVPGGFVVGFRDASGARHMLRVRGLEEGFRGLAEGRQFGFAYREDTDTPPDAATVDRYRAIADALLEREDQLAEDLRSDEDLHPPREAFDLDAQPPASEPFAAWVRTRLPADWRVGARVVRVPGGFAVGFGDASGARHVLWARGLEEGFRTLLEGRRLGMAALEDPNAPPDAATLARYRTVAEILLHREDKLTEELRRRGAGALADTGAPGTGHQGFDLLDGPPVDETFGQWVRARLPEDWRTDATVVLVPGGFAVGFRDASGARHMLRGRGLPVGLRALAEGRRFGFAYREDGEEPPDAATVERYRAVARTLLRREDRLAEGIRPEADPGASRQEVDLGAQPAAPEALRARVLARLPADGRAGARVVLVPGGFALGFGDVTGARHVLWVHALEAGFRTVAEGQRLTVAALEDPGVPEDTATLGRYREIAEALLGQEETLTEELRRRGAGDPVVPGAPGTPAPSQGFALLEQPAVDETFGAWVRGVLPEDGRAGARVVLVPGGFAVGFGDASGGRHMLRVQGLPEGFRGIAEGRRFRVAYREDPGVSLDAATVDRYRALADDLIQDEEQLAEDLHPTLDPRGQPGDFDLGTQPAAPEALGAWVRGVLPEEWRADVRVVRVPRGFAVGFGDATGARHVLWVRALEEGFRTLVEGQRLGVAALQDAGAPADAATLARYRAVADVLLGQEDELAEELRRRAARAPTEAMASGHEGLALLDLPAVDEALGTRVRTVLPEDWRADVRVVLVPGGFALGFGDASGARHMLRVQGLPGGLRALAEGRRFGFAYREDARTPPDAATVARYRAVVGALLRREDQIAEGLRPEKDTPGRPRDFDLGAQPAAPKALAGRVLAGLPTDWRAGARVVLVPGGFALGFGDASGAQHVLWVHALEAGFQTVAEGQRLTVAALEDPGVPEDTATVGRYREIAEALLGQEEKLTEELRRRGAGDPVAPSVPGTPTPHQGFALLDQPAADETFGAWVRGVLPEDWRAGARVVLVPGGFALGFGDVTGARHMLRVQGLHEGLLGIAEGRRFRVAYLEATDTPPDAATLTRYRVFAGGMLQHEDALAEDLNPTRDLRARSEDFALAGLPAAPEAFGQWVSARLPEDWRTDVRVVRVPRGFAVGFRDARGGQHALWARGLEEGYRTLVEGRRLGFASLDDASAPPEVATVERYRAVADTLLGQEDVLAEELRRRAARAPTEAMASGHEGFALLDLPAVDEALADRVRGALPEDWRADVRVVLVPGGFALGFRDASGARHMLRGRGLDEGLRPLAEGRRYGFAYLEDESTPPDAATIERYRGVAEALLRREDLIVEGLRPAGQSPGEAGEAREAVTSQRRGTGAQASAGEGLDVWVRTKPPADAALTEWALARVPEDWRAGARVVLAPEGFAVGMRDARGVPHVVLVQALAEGTRALVRGQRYGFAYLEDPAAPQDTATVQRYHALAEELLGEEDFLAAQFHLGEPGHAVGPSRGSSAAARPSGDDGFGAWLRALGPQDEGFDAWARALVPADETLTGWVRARLPEDWRAGAQVMRAPQGVAVGVRDAAGVPHVVLVQELHEGFGALVLGQRYGFAYLGDGDVSPATLRLYGAVAEALLRQEDELAAILRPAGVAR